MAVATFNGRYELLSRISNGGMGDVWVAADTRLGRKVALKLVLGKALAENPGAEKILEDEARAAGSLIGHEEIVGVLDLIDVDSEFHRGPAIVMEFVDGCNLMEWITTHRAKISDSATMRLLDYYVSLQMCEAVDLAHKRGLIHRDIKPHNVLISNSGAVKVADFGLARVTEALTRSHTVWNHKTPLYAAPEQWNDERPVQESDTYQLSATLYHLLAGTPPCPAENVMGVVKWHAEGSKVVPLSDVASDVSEPVARLIEKGLSVAPSDRPALWSLVNAFSHSLIQEIQFAVDATKCTDQSRARVSKITDYGEDELKAGPYAVRFPHPLEALREAIAVILSAPKADVKLMPVGRNSVTGR